MTSWCNAALCSGCGECDLAMSSQQYCNNEGLDPHSVWIIVFHGHSRVRRTQKKFCMHPDKIWPISEGPGQKSPKKAHSVRRDSGTLSWQASEIPEPNLRTWKTLLRTQPLIDERDMISSISPQFFFPKVYWRQDVHIVHAPLSFWKISRCYEYQWSWSCLGII
jgi:hypothetical protein